MDLILVLAGAITGAAAAVAGRVVEYLLARSHRRESEQDRYQRETLLEVQETMLTMSDHLGTLRTHLVEYIDQYHGDWDRPVALAIEYDVFRADIEALKAVSNRLTMLRERVLDDDVRHGVEIFQSKCNQLLYAERERVAWTSSQEADALYNSASTRIGQLLRARY
jgi:hypothetical protein